MYNFSKQSYLYFSELAEQPESVEGIREMWRELVQHRMALVCFQEGSDEIVGLNMTYVSSKNDKEDYVVSFKFRYQAFFLLK